MDNDKLLFESLRDYIDYNVELKKIYNVKFNQSIKKFP
jgi:hypothetical protein